MFIALNFIDCCLFYSLAFAKQMEILSVRMKIKIVDHHFKTFVIGYERNIECRTLVYT